MYTAKKNDVKTPVFVIPVANQYPYIKKERKMKHSTIK